MPSDRHFSDTLLQWYALYRRDLPWRRTRDPYAVWLSEIILQQTRVVQGRAYWERFLERFPTVEDLAAASEDEVLRLWEGLGYYSRARNLHAAARQIVSMGGFPRTLEGIRSLRGVGDYTAAAIASIAFGLPVAVLDGNVYRVLARHFGIFTPVGTTAARKEFATLAQALLPPAAAADYNQALMDFGALQCTPGRPDCAACPLAATCHAFRLGQVEQLPVKKPAVAVQERHLTYIYLRYGGSVAFRRRGPGDIWQGLWEPLLLSPSPTAAPEGTQAGSHETGVVGVTEGYHEEALSDKDLAATVPKDARLIVRGLKHQLTHRILFADFYLWEPDAQPALPDGYCWIPETELAHYAKPRLVLRLMDALGAASTLR